MVEIAVLQALRNELHRIMKTAGDLERGDVAKLEKRYFQTITLHNIFTELFVFGKELDQNVELFANELTKGRKDLLDWRKG